MPLPVGAPAGSVNTQHCHKCRENKHLNSFLYALSNLLNMAIAIVAALVGWSGLWRATIDGVWAAWPPHSAAPLLL